MAFKTGIDFGQGPDKATFANINNTQLCSNSLQSIMLNIEPMKINGPNAADTYENYKKSYPLIPSAADVQSSCVMRYGDCHCIFPAHKQRDEDPARWPTKTMHT